MKWISIILSLLLLTSCRKHEPELPAQKTLIIGHGGSGFESFTNPVPANTLISVRRAIEGLGVDGVEVDVQMSRDHQLVLFHDMELERQTDCVGCVSVYRAGELLKCRYKADAADNIYGKETITTLEALFKLYLQYQPKPLLFLDLRYADACGSFPRDTIARILVDMIEQYEAWDWTVAESSDLELLSRIRSQSNQVRLMANVHINEVHLKHARTLGLEGFVVSNKAVSVELIDSLRTGQLQVVLFNVKNHLSVKEALAKHPFAIQGDNLELLQDYSN